MPATRFASTTTNTVDAPVQSQQQLRQSRFLAKKTLEPLTAFASEVQKFLVDFLKVLLIADKQHLLFTSTENNKEQQQQQQQSQQNQIEFETIEDRVYRNEYQTLSNFKSDLDKLFTKVLSSLSTSREETNAFTQLYQFSTNRLLFEAKRLNQELEKTDDVYRLTALFRPTIDGYAFTDLSLKAKDSKPIMDLPFNVQEIQIHPFVSSAQNEVPSLKHTVAPPPKYISKTIKHENKPVIPIQWLDFGAFSSFAPATDSNNANASYEGTYMGRSAKRFKRWEKKHLKDSQNNHHTTEQDESTNKQANQEWLEKEGFDIDALEAALDTEPESISEELERNSELLKELVKYQEQRFASTSSSSSSSGAGKGESKWANVGEKEIEIARALQNNIAEMISRLPPSATKESSELIEKTMERIPLLEPAYRGTLPPHKIFSFPTTEKAEPLPPYANITPTYSKDNWRLVKVAPIPTSSKDVSNVTGTAATTTTTTTTTNNNNNNNNNNSQPSSSSNPVNSMIEQQHINFYPKQQQQQQPNFNTPTPPMPPQPNVMPNMYQQRK